MKQDTAAAVCDRIVFDLTVAVVKSDNTFFHNIIEGIVIDAPACEQKNLRFFKEKYAVIEANEVRYEEYMMDDAEYAL